MKIKIAGKTIDKWSNLSVTRIYDSVKSVFSFDLYWNPWDANMRDIMLPGAYLPCTIVSDKGETVLTGVMHSPSFRDSAEPSLVNISGCSITGVLDDCEFAALKITATQTTGKSILQIAQLICNELGLGLKDLSGGAANATVSSSDADRDQTCTGYLSDLCKETNIVLSHDAAGNLVLSIASATKPVYDFESGTPGITFDLAFDGQSMHSIIIAAAQGGASQTVYVSNPYVPSKGAFNYRNAAINTGNIFNAPAGQLNLLNEFSTGYRPKSVIQTSTDSNSLDNVAKQTLADELRAISLTIQMKAWAAAGVLIEPAQIITVRSPYLYLFNKTKFFVQSVTYSGDEKQSTATLNCVVPEVFNGKAPVNIFISQGNNTNFKAGFDNPPPLREQSNFDL